MDIDKITMPKDKAKTEWKAYNDLLKTRKEKYLDDMKKCMFQFKEGRELIDIYKVMEKAGLNKHYQPKMAIARADWSEAFFIKKDAGRGFFAGQSTSWPQRSKGDVDLQPETFMNWPRGKDLEGKDNPSQWAIPNSNMKTKMPIIPAYLMPEGKLSEYYILWEVDEWETVPKADDPLLLKRITENLFVILGAWDVTVLEQSIINGL